MSGQGYCDGLEVERRRDRFALVGWCWLVQLLESVFGAVVADLLEDGLLEEVCAVDNASQLWQLLYEGDQFALLHGLVDVSKDLAMVDAHGLLLFRFKSIL